MKNSLNISVAGEDLISTVDDSTNRLFINGTEVPSTSWTGSGTYSTTVNGHAITITQVEDTTGNVAIRMTAAYTYELYKIRTGDVTITGDLTVTGSISEGGTPLSQKYAPKSGGALWTNNSPSSSFAAQTIQLSETAANFDILIVYLMQSTGNDVRTHSIIGTDTNKPQLVYVSTETLSNIYCRSFSVNGTSVDISGVYANGTSVGGNNAIPLSILGIKF